MLDMSLPVRMAGLMNGQELEALRISLKAAAGIKANISVQLPTGKRVQNHYPANLTLWDLLHQVESASEVPITNVTDPKTGKYMMPSLTIMNREFSTLQLLKESTLYGVGASKAPILFRLKFKPSDLTLAEVMEQEEKDKKKESDAAEAAVAAAVTPAESAAPKAEAMIPVKEEDSAMEVEPEKKKAVITESQPKDSMAIEDKSDEKKRMEVSEAEKERIVQEYLKRYQLTDDDLQKFKEEQQAKAQAAQMHNQQAPAPAVAAKEAKEEEEKERYDPYGAATDEDVPESEREVHVYSPSTGKYNPADYDVPDEFFELTAEDLRMLRQNSAKEAEEARMLMTREMRERRARAHCKVFERCRIRVRFPDMVELQRVFLPNAKVGAIFRLVRESLADPTTEFSLFTTPPNRPLGNPEATLARRGLVPATIVHVRFAKPVVVGGGSGGYLKPELEAKIVARSAAPVVPAQNAPRKTGGTTSSSGHTLVGTNLCAQCMGSIGLEKCLECDNYYCRRCWNEVHKDGPMTEHHKASPSSNAPLSNASKKKKPMTEEEKKHFVPKWFKLGKQ